MASSKIPSSEAKTHDLALISIARLLAVGFTRASGLKSTGLPADGENIGLSNHEQQSGYDVDQTKDLMP